MLKRLTGWAAGLLPIQKVCEASVGVCEYFFLFQQGSGLAKYNVLQKLHTKQHWLHWNPSSQWKELKTFSLYSLKCAQSRPY